MKITTLLIPGLFCLVSAGAFAQGQTDIDAHRAIHADHRDIAVEKSNLARDKQIAHMEKHDAIAIKRRQQDLAAHGDYRGAQRLERERQHQKNVAKIARRQVQHDRNVIAIKRQDVQHNRNVVAIDHQERVRNGGY